MSQPVTDILTDVEEAELRFLTGRYVEERNAKNYVLSDAYRQQLFAAGIIDLKNPMWHPVFEDSGHRQKRLSARWVDVPSV